MSQMQSKAEQPHPSPSVPRDVQHILEALKVFRGVPMDVSIELGKGKLKIRDLLGLRYHSIFELDKPAGSMLNVYINGVLLGKGEPIVLEDRVGIKIDEFAEHDDRNIL